MNGPIEVEVWGRVSLIHGRVTGSKEHSEKMPPMPEKDVVFYRVSLIEPKSSESPSWACIEVVERQGKTFGLKLARFQSCGGTIFQPN